MSSKTKRLLQFLPEHHNEVTHSHTPSTGGFVPKLKPFFIPYANSRRRIYKAGKQDLIEDVTTKSSHQIETNNNNNEGNQLQIQELNVIIDKTVNQIDFLITFLEKMN